MMEEERLRREKEELDLRYKRELNDRHKAYESNFSHLQNKSRALR